MQRTVATLVGALLLGVSACSDLAPTGALTGASTLRSTEASVSGASVFPDVISLPVNPEGIAVGTGSTFYVGNLVSGGAIYHGDLRTGDIALLRPADGKATLGLKFDDRSGYLFAARGGTGWATVIDAATGATVVDMQVAPTASATAPSFVNDVIVTRTAAYFTDSRRPVLYRVPLGAGGELLGGFDVLPLTGDFVQGPITCTLPVIGGAARPGPLFANGIEATPDGQWLIVNSLANGRLYRVDPASGEAIGIDLGVGDVCLADGNVLAGRTLYVMENLANRIAVVELSRDYLSGTITRYITGTVPMTTMARFGNSLYAVTAGFTFLPASQPKQIVRFDMR